MGHTTSDTQLAQTKSALPSPNAPHLNIVAGTFFLVPLIIGIVLTVFSKNPIGVIVGIILGLILSQAPKVAKQWEKAVVLRLGRYDGVKGPGLFWIVPFIETVSSWIDQRVITTSFAAEREGYTILTDAIMPLPYNSVVSTRKFAKQNPDVMRRFIKAHLEAVHLLKTDREAAIRTLAKYLRQTKERQLLEKSYDITTGENILPRKQYPTNAGIKTVLDSLVKVYPRAATAKRILFAHPAPKPSDATPPAGAESSRTR